LKFVEKGKLLYARSKFKEAEEILEDAIEKLRAQSGTTKW
jgi:hypothetical protein